MRCLVVISLLGLALPGWAQPDLASAETRFGFETGVAGVRGADFYTSNPWSLYSGLSRDGWSSDLFYENLGLFSSRRGQGEVLIHGSGLRVEHDLPVGDLFVLKPAAGLFLWQAQAQQFSRSIGRDSGASSVFQVSSSISFLDVFALDFFARHYTRVTGSAIESVGLGLRYHVVLP